MGKSNYKKRTLAILTIALAMVLVLSCIICLRGRFENNQTFEEFTDNNNAIVNSAYTVTHDTGKLGKFANGSTYAFTDKSKIDGLRGGSATTDVTIITVDSTKNHGTQQNPYVIDSVSDWELFAKQVGPTSSTRGLNDYYVLAKDITFNNNFRPIPYFKGTFYGLGFTLSNAVCSSWTYWNGSSWAAFGTTTYAGYGLFGCTESATITDLIVQNYKFSGMPNTTISDRSNLHGGLVGITYGNDIILNCHLQGEINEGSTTYANYSWQGGLIGYSHNGLSSGTPTVKIYRCSVNTKITNSTAASNNPHVGGIVGEASYNVKMYIYDCVSYLNFVRGKNLGFLSSAVNVTRETTTLVIENLVTVMRANNSLPTSYAIGAYGPTSSLKNVYVDTLVGTSTKLNANVQNPSSASNVHRGPYVNATGVSPAPTAHSTPADLINAAKNDIGTKLSNKIWDADKMSTAAQVTPANSPVRNFLTARVTFVNLTNTSEDSLGIKTQDFLPGSALPEPQGSYVKDNHDFKGWTMKTDDIGDEDIFDESPAKVFGDVKFYAVWTLPGDYVSKQIDTSLNVDKTTMEYDGVDSINLTAKVTHQELPSGGMKDVVVTYKFKQDGDVKDTNTSGALSLSKVKDTGTYNYSYRITDSREPLWYYDGISKSTDDKEITIEKGKVASFTAEVTIDSTTKPYLARALGSRKAADGVKFTFTVKNRSDEPIVVDDYDWASIYYTVDVRGTNTKGVTFEPHDKENYDSSYTINVDFEAEYLYLIFKMTGLPQDLKVEVSYNNNYTSNMIIYLFEQEYLRQSAAHPEIYDDVAQLAPYLDGKPLVANVRDSQPYNGSFSNIKKDETVTVTFKDVPYAVTFDPDNGDAPTQANYSYGQYISPEPTEPIKGEKLFLGWYFDEEVVDDNGNKTTVHRKWRFSIEGSLDADRVTKTVTLTAEYLSASDLDKIEITVNSEKEFFAFDTIKEGDIVVVATYIGVSDDGNTTVTRPVTLAWTKYKDSIKYYLDDQLVADNALHVPKTKMEIEVSYKLPGADVSQTKSARATIVVNPIPIDTSVLDFGQNSNNEVFFEADNVNPKNLTKPDSSEYIPLHIDDIEFEYYKGLTRLEPEDVIKAGDYTVKVIFDTTDDYKANELVLKLTLGTYTDVYIVWDYDDSSPFMYNGKAQAPTAKVHRVSNDTEITNVSVEYSGDTGVIARGNNYSIKAVLTGNYRIVEGESCNFRIVKAVLDAPKLKDDAKIVYNGVEQKFEDFFDFDSDLIKIDNGGVGIDVGNYTAILSLKDTNNCEWSSTSGAVANTVLVKWTIEKAHLTAVWDGDEHVSDGKEFTPKVVSFVGIAPVDINAVDYDNDITYEGDVGKSAVGAYNVKAVLNAQAAWTKNYILDGNVDWAYVIIPQDGMEVITIEWQNTNLVFNGKVQMPEYKVLDKDGNDITEDVKGMLTFGGDYDKSKWADDYSLTVNQPKSKYFIKSGLTCDYTISIDANGNGYNPNGDEKEKDGLSFDNVGDMLKQWWQVIASAVSIVLIVLFTGKGIGYANKKKQAKSMADDRYKAYYAGATGLFGLAMTNWTIIACVLMGLALLSFIFMLLMKKGYTNAQRELDYAREEYNRNRADQEARQRDENMKMMFMSMMGGNANGMAQGGFAGGGYGIGAEEMRGLITETVSALLPGVQQALPQQASTNDELVEKLIQQNEKLMEKLSEQKTTEKIVERQVAATMVSSDDATLQKLVERSEKNDERIEQLMRNQEALISKLLQKEDVPQVVEKVIEKEVPVEKIVEKVVEVPVEKIVEKEVKVEVPVEVIKEVPVEVEKIVEVPVEVEKIVEKEVIKEVKVAAPAKPKKEVAPKLTLDEAYALLSKEQKKYFDGLRDYALNKYKCKEKKSTYFVTYGQTTTNPLLKLTIKKDTTVALYKMEDEYLKDIKRDASGEGTKIKVKETELIVSDAQAYETAKNMVDLREDQIERYNDLLKEQRSVRSKK